MATPPKKTEYTTPYATPLHGIPQPHKSTESKEPSYEPGKAPTWDTSKGKQYEYVWKHKYHENPKFDSITNKMLQGILKDNPELFFEYKFDKINTPLFQNTKVHAARNLILSDPFYYIDRGFYKHPDLKMLLPFLFEGIQYKTGLATIPEYVKYPRLLKVVEEILNMLKDSDPKEYEYIMHYQGGDEVFETKKEITDAGGRGTLESIKESNKIFIINDLIKIADLLDQQNELISANELDAIIKEL